MNKFFTICLASVLLLSGCGKSQEETKKEEKQKTIMGTGNIPLSKPGQSPSGL